MLDKPGCEIVFDETGKAIGVKDADGAMAKCDAVVCDPSYAKDKCKVTGKVRRGMEKQLAWNIFIFSTLKQFNVMGYFTIKSLLTEVETVHLQKNMKQLM